MPLEESEPPTMSPCRETGKRGEEMIKITFAYPKYALGAITAVAFTACPS